MFGGNLVFGLSEQQTKYQSTNRCPSGHWVIPPFKTLSFYAADGTAISPITPFPLMDRSAVAECPVDHERWPVFATAADSGHRPEPPEAVVEETHRTKVDWYIEEKIVDN